MTTCHYRIIVTSYVETKSIRRHIMLIKDTRQDIRIGTWKLLSVPYAVYKGLFHYQVKVVWRFVTEIVRTVPNHFHAFFFQTFVAIKVVNSGEKQCIQTHLRQSVSSIYAFIRHTQITCANIDADSLLWPNGSICHATFGIPHLPKVSFKNLWPMVIWSIIAA